MPNIRQLFRTHGRTIYSVTAVIAATIIACVLIKTLAPTNTTDHRNPQIPNSGAPAQSYGASGAPGTTIPAVPEGTQAPSGTSNTPTTQGTPAPVIYYVPASTAGTDGPPVTEGATTTTVATVATSTTTTTAPTPMTFAPGAVAVSELDKPPSICPTNVQCISQFTWTVTSGAVSDGVLTVVQDSVSIVAPAGQNMCYSTEVIENTDSGSTISVTSSNCSVSGAAIVGTNGMTYSAPGYLTTTLRPVGYNGTEYFWSN